MRRCAVAATVPLLVALMVAGCGPKKDAADANNGRAPGDAARAVAAVPPQPAPESVLHGTVVAIRPVPADGGMPFAMLADPAGPMRGQVRLAVAAASPGQAQATTFEFVVRVGDSTVCVVQANPDGLRPGERVDVIRADRTRLARPA